jgi:hypothetical protein
MSYPQIGKKTLGRDYNFFQRIDVTATEFGNHPDMVVTFPTHGIMFLNEGDGVVEVSYNGNTVHGSFNSDDPSKGISYDNRVVSLIWFRVASGSTGPITMRVEAW